MSNYFSRIIQNTFLIFILLFLSQTMAYAKQCTVLRVRSGDQLTVQCADEKLQVRLYGIRTPRKNQPFGIEAKEYIKQAVLGKNVDVITYDTGRKGRSLVIIRHGGFTLNEMLLRNGLALFNEEQCEASFCSDFHMTEQQSRKLKIGLWQDETTHH